MKLRRCEEDREDFTAEDGNSFPILIDKGGTPYGFCPAKSFWDESLVAHFQELLLMCEFKSLPTAGGLYEQDTDLIMDLMWFMPKYEMMKFGQKASMILGDSSSNSGKPSQGRQSGHNKRNLKSNR